MENSTDPSDLPLSEWFWVSISTVCLLDTRPKSSVSAHFARKFGCRRLLGDILPPELPRAPLSLHFGQPGRSARAPPRHSVGFTINPGSPSESHPWYPRPVRPSTPNRRHLVCANSITPSTSDPNVPPTQLVLYSTEGLPLRAKAVGFHPIGKHLLRGKWSPWGQHGGCTPGGFCGTRLKR